MKESTTPQKCVVCHKKNNQNNMNLHHHNNQLDTAQSLWHPRLYNQHFQLLISSGLSDVWESFLFVVDQLTHLESLLPTQSFYKGKLIYWTKSISILLFINSFIPTKYIYMCYACCCCVQPLLSWFQRGAPTEPESMLIVYADNLSLHVSSKGYIPRWFLCWIHGKLDR